MRAASGKGKVCWLSSSRAWAKEEFSGACLGDQRLLKRLVTVSADFLENLNSSIPGACGGDWAKTKAAYRFFANEQVTAAKLLASHGHRTAERAQGPSFQNVADEVEDRFYMRFSRLSI